MRKEGGEIYSCALFLLRVDQKQDEVRTKLVKNLTAGPARRGGPRCTNGKELKLALSFPSSPRVRRMPGGIRPSAATAQAAICPGMAVSTGSPTAVAPSLIEDCSI